MNHESVYTTIVEDLQARYGHALQAEEIASVVAGIRASHEATATVSTFVPVLVERSATAALEGIVLTEPMRLVSRRRGIAVVARNNRALAEVVAAMLRHHGGSAVDVATLATHPENTDDRLLEQRAGLLGLELTGETYRPHRLLETADLVIYLDEEATDVAGRSYATWDLGPIDGISAHQARRLMYELERNVLDVLDQLGVERRVEALV
ncbi:three-helix bundle dimerization domain-containing protein [Corynebacterium uterequi]|uniref:Protein-tyrosine-phosphatase n=1 Tax=Corynebacterium uterequi TaxID=1072256 RepID=A0A0G3HLP4_9CORY|nr:hypothetical protein [Corynebacterium uterequi]AKK12052.1 hypothetical protein CUTER_10440 [Corynebacterium uterequi]